MTSHLLLLAGFAFFVSLVFAVLAKDHPRDQLRFGGLLFAGFVGTAIAVSWLMFPFPLQRQRSTHAIVGIDRGRLQLWAPVVIYMALIFAISSISRPPDLPSSIGDKGGHALLYFGLGALLVRALAGGWWRPLGVRTAFAAFIYSTVYGVTDEIHQIFVPPRTAEVADLVADAAGAAAAVIVAYAAHAVRARFGR